MFKIGRLVTLFLASTLYNRLRHCCLLFLCPFLSNDLCFPVRFLARFDDTADMGIRLWYLVQESLCRLGITWSQKSLIHPAQSWTTCCNERVQLSCSLQLNSLTWTYHLPKFTPTFHGANTNVAVCNTANCLNNNMMSVLCLLTNSF